MSFSNRKTVFFPKQGKWISLITTFLSLTLVFVAGLFHSSTNIEKIAEYASSVVLNNTKNQKYCSITVQTNNDSGNIADSYSEFNNLYGVFQQRKITFASAMNMFDQSKGDKEHQIKIKKNDDYLSDNLSFFYLGPCGSVEYRADKNDELHYKHYIYPLETMFADDSERGNKLPTHYIAYISQTHADNLLAKEGVLKTDGIYSKEQYKNLLGKTIDIQIDNNEKTDEFVIMNIYYSQNYYYLGINEVMGDFIAVSYYVPFNLRQEQKNVYFMSEYTYQNRYFMNYINSVYSSKKYNVSVNHFNVDGNINDDYLLSFYYSTFLKTYDWVSTLLLIFAASLLLISLVIVCKPFEKNLIKIDLPLIFNVVILFIPFLIFLLIFKSTGNLSFMSELSSKTNATYILSFIVLFILIFAIKKSNLLGRWGGSGDYYEFSI